MKLTEEWYFIGKCWVDDKFVGMIVVKAFGGRYQGSFEHAETTRGLLPGGWRECKGIKQFLNFDTLFECVNHYREAVTKYYKAATLTDFPEGWNPIREKIEEYRGLTCKLRTTDTSNSDS